jgi:CDP-diacylglycerol--serine O-phosphatidyltransferase
LPTLFTAGNIFLGYLCVLRTVQGALIYPRDPSQAAADFAVAAKTIGFAVLLDGIDGRVARMTNTTSEFGRELDSLADVISFGIAPALLAYVWGVAFVAPSVGSWPLDHLQRAGKLLSFLFLVCGAMRLARFNIQKNPSPSNPGRPSRKYFVGLAIPAAAGMIGAVVFAFDSYPITGFYWSLMWLFLLALLSFLMVSTWRYWSFKELNMLRPMSPVVLVLMGAAIYLIWNWAQPVLLIVASTYVASGIVLRAGSFVRRHFRRKPHPLEGPKPEAQIG